MKPMLLWRKPMLLVILLFAIASGSAYLFNAHTVHGAPPQAQQTSVASTGTRRAASTIDLSAYVRIGRYNLPVPVRVTAPTGSQLALEVSAVTYNPNTDTLFVLGDEGTSIVQVGKNGQLIDSMTLAFGEFADPEGLTHVSGSQFVLVEERLRQANLFTYTAGGTLSRADVQSVKLGTTVGNIGLEGISSDPQTSGYILVKETNPQGIFQTGIDFGAGTATNGSPATENSTNLFDPALAGLTDIADVYALSNLPAPLTDGNLLVLSQEDGRIVNINRSGTISNTLAIASDPDNPLNVAGQGHEGVTMDNDGLLYIVNEQGGGDSGHPQLWVYAPSSYVYTNTAPVEVSLSNVTTSLPENSSTAAPIRLGTIVVSDDALGTNTLSLTGADADDFEITGTGLFLKAGTVLDFETKPSYQVTVNVDDASVGASPDASRTFTLEITDTSDAPAALIVSEVAPWSSGNSPGVGADWFEVTNVSTTTVDITGWRIDDDSASFANSSALSGVTSLAPGQSAVFVDGDANTITAFVNTWFGGTLPGGVLMGTYGGPGLGTGGDAVNLFDAGGTLITGVTFGASPSASPFATFDNAAGLPSVSTLSVVGVNGAYSVIDVGVTEAAVLIGSPGTISVAPVPLTTRVGIVATDAAAAEEGQNPGTFTVLRTGGVTDTLSVNYTISGNADAADYTPTLPTNVTIPAAASQVTITITPVDDAVAESTESVILTLVDSADYDFVTNAVSATVTIADNDSTVADFNLQITEIWPGNSEGDDLTEDWFEITNIGTEAWVSGVAPDLFYDDDSQDPTTADLISGLTQIDPGKSAVVVIGAAADAQTFSTVWSPVIDLTGVEIGFTDGAGLGANGDGVSLFVGLPGTGSTPVDFETYPAGSAGRSYDVGLADFSVAGQNGAVATAPNADGQSAVGSPGRPLVAPGQPLPLSEGFDDCTLAGWEIVSADADTANTWTCNATFSNTEANGFGDSAAADEWLITPPLDMDAQDNDRLTFRTWTRFTDSGIPYPQLRVKYATDYAGGGDPTTATWTELTGITFSPENSQQWTDSGVIDLSALTGNRVYFAFHYRSSGTGGGTSTSWRLDSINFAVDTSGPTVTTFDPADGASGVAVDTDLIVTFDEAVQTGTGDITIHLAADNSVVQTIEVTSTHVTISNTQVTINPPADLATDTAYYVNIAAGALQDTAGNDFAGITDATTWDFTTSAPAITLISAIQGSGDSVTGAGPFVVEAIVVGDYQTQGDGQLRGFFLQEEDADADSDPATSEGIFVFCSGCPTPVAVGDKVQVTGGASDFFNMSQLTATTVESVVVISSGNTLPTPATVQLPVPGLPSGNLETATAAINAYYEPFEGMLVTFPDTLSVSEYFELARYGQVILTEGGRPYQFTNVNAPSVNGLVNHEIDLAGRTIILDDTDNRQNRPIDTPNTAYFHPVPGLSTINFFRGGDTITNLTGVLHWSFAGQNGTDAWRIRPVTETFSYTFTSVNPRPAAPTVTGTLTVASFNVLNYFLTIDTTSSGSSGDCGASATLDCRGPDSESERDRQQAKLTGALVGLDADIVGLIEVENTPNVDPLAEIVADLNAVVGAGAYAAIDTGVVGTDAIKVGFIYKPGAVTPIGAPLIDNSAVHNRPPVAQLFEDGNGARFSVVVNHFKSKGCGGATDANTDQGDGQGCFNAQRVEQAQALLSFITGTITTQTGDPDVLIIGDLNAYAQEDPITTLENAGFTNLVAQFGGADAYSYVFDGQLGYLDHALASASLAPQVTGANEWHINADEIPLFDYNDDVRDTGESSFEEKSDTRSLYAADPFRTSDHDPVIVGITLDAPTPPTLPIYLPLISR